MPASNQHRYCFLISLELVVCVLPAGVAVAATQFSETWESCTNGVTPYGDWQLGSGTGFTWGSISTSGLNGTKCYTIAAGQKSRIVIQLGQNTSVEAAAESIARFQDPKNVDAAFKALRDAWREYRDL